MAFPIYGDENAQRRVLLRRLRAANVDAMLSNEAGNGALTDEQQLAFATAAGRAILTHDQADFQRLHGLWARSGRSHAGIIIITDPHASQAVVFAKVMKLQAERSAADMRNAILFIGPTPLEENQ